MKAGNRDKFQYFGIVPVLSDKEAFSPRSVTLPAHYAGLYPVFPKSPSVRYGAYPVS